MYTSEGNICCPIGPARYEICDCDHLYEDVNEVERRLKSISYEKPPSGLYRSGTIDFLTTYQHDYERLDPNISMEKVKPAKIPCGSIFDKNIFYGESTQRMDYNYHAATGQSVKIITPKKKLMDHGVVIPRPHSGQTTGRTLYMDEFPKKRAINIYTKKITELRLGEVTNNLWKSETREKYVPQIFTRPPRFTQRAPEDEPVFPIISQTNVAPDKTEVSQYTQEYTQWDYKNSYKRYKSKKRCYQRPTVPFADTSTYMSSYPALLPIKKVDPVIPKCTCITVPIPRDKETETKQAMESPCGPYIDKVCQEIKEADDWRSKLAESLEEHVPPKSLPSQGDPCENSLPSASEYRPRKTTQPFLLNQWDIASPFSSQCMDASK